MAENYVLLETIELTQSAASVTFDNIPQTGYTDLKIVASARSDYNGAGGGSSLRDNLNFYFNGLSASGNWSTKQLYGIPGVVTGSGGGTGGNSGAVGYSNGAGNTSNSYGSCELYIPNYNSTSTYKSISAEGISESNDTSTGLQLNANLYSSTSAVTSVTLFSGNSANLIAGSTFSLYGVAAVGTTPTVAPLATGGNIVANDGTYWYHTFLTSGTFTPQTALTCDYLVVAGGGGGGSGIGYGSGGGGGAGGYRTSIGGTPLTLSLNTSYAVTVGAGGTAQTNTTAYGGQGNNSVFASITSSGGGGGGPDTGASPAGSGRSGGSGGGSSSSGIGGTGNAGSYSPVEGYNGGSTAGVASFGSGGGGSSGAGTSETSTRGGNGGSGTTSSITGTSVTYAGGGGGGALYGNAGGTGAAGGGNGATDYTTNATSASANTGSGGGGARQGSAGTGGSGIVIIRYSMV